MRLALIAVLVGLAACQATVQTTSGAKYLAARPDFHPDPNDGVQGFIYKAASVEPDLRFPARLGLARIKHGQLTTIPPAEADIWLALVRDQGVAYGEFVPISPLVTRLTVASLGMDRAADVTEQIRVGAARQHVDAVLIYELADRSTDKASPLSLADWTILGAYLVPSRSVEGQATADAMLIDVRNGYPYGSVTATADKSSFVPSVGSERKAVDLGEAAEPDAVGKLAPEVARMLARLKTELDALPRPPRAT